MQVLVQTFTEYIFMLFGAGNLHKKKLVQERYQT